MRTQSPIEFVEHEIKDFRQLKIINFDLDLLAGVPVSLHNVALMPLVYSF